MCIKVAHSRSYICIVNDVNALTYGNNFSERYYFCDSNIPRKRNFFAESKRTDISKRTPRRAAQTHRHNRQGTCDRFAPQPLAGMESDTCALHECFSGRGRAAVALLTAK